MDNNLTAEKLTAFTKPLRACAVVVAIAIIGLIVMLIVLARMPVFHSLMLCRENMVTINSALERYHSVNNKYPASLEDLKADYIKDPSVLNCPLDKNPSESSYRYSQPKPGDGARVVVLECDRHVLKKGMGPTKVVLHKDGDVELISPTFKETMKRAQHLEKAR